jgi:hypothetical protein
MCKQQRRPPGTKDLGLDPASTGIVDYLEAMNQWPTYSF